MHRGLRRALRMLSCSSTLHSFVLRSFLQSQIAQSQMVMGSLDRLISPGRKSLVSEGVDLSLKYVVQLWHQPNA